MEHHCPRYGKWSTIARGMVLCVHGNSLLQFRRGTGHIGCLCNILQIYVRHKDGKKLANSSRAWDIKQKNTLPGTVVRGPPGTFSSLFCNSEVIMRFFCVCFQHGVPTVLSSTDASVCLQCSKYVEYRYCCILKIHLWV